MKGGVRHVVFQVDFIDFHFDFLILFVSGSVLDILLCNSLNISCWVYYSGFCYINGSYGSCSAGLVVVVVDFVEK